MHQSYEHGSVLMEFHSPKLNNAFYVFNCAIVMDLFVKAKYCGFCISVNGILMAVVCFVFFAGDETDVAADAEPKYSVAASTRT